MPSLERCNIAGLNCHVIQPDKPPQKIAVFCHGFGAPGDDLVPLGAELASQHASILEQYMLVFPAAPISLANQGMPGALAWWPLDMLRMQQAIQSGHMRDLRKDSPEELPAARSMIIALLEELLDSNNLKMSDVVLGGFSQGSMLATDVCLHLKEKPAGLIIWSGTLLNEDEWASVADSLSGLSIVQSHGTQDPILPFEAAIWLNDLLVKSNADVNFIEFRGQHSIPPQALEAAARLLLQQIQ